MMGLVNIYIKLIRAQILSQMQYRFSFLLDILSTGLMNGLYFFSLYLVMQRFESISGWTFWQIALLIGTVETSFGFTDMIFSGFDPDISFVRRGTLDQLLLRPVNITLQVLGSRFVLRRIGRVFQGIIIFSLAVFHGDIAWSIPKALYLLVTMFSQVFAFGGLFIIGSTITFWTIERIEAINILTYGGVEMMSYPVDIFPNWLRKFFTYGIPFIFLNYLPMVFILDNPDPLNFPMFAQFLSPVAAILLFSVSIWFWNYGVNHYQSTGS